MPTLIIERSDREYETIIQREKGRPAFRGD
jgi:hypothetical protein